VASAKHPRPHTVLSTATGRLIGIDLFDRNQIPSPLIQIIAAPRGGKSILMAQFACDILASLRDASVNAVDIGETLLPLVTVLGGRYIRPQPDEVRAINIWAYPDLKYGEMPDDVQKALVVGDLKMLARVKDDDKIAEDVISAVVSQVYENIVPENGLGRPLFEPTLSHFVAQLRTFPFDSEMVRERRETLVLALSKLLRVLQEQEFERLGSTHTRQVDVRLVAATNRDLTDMMKQGEFRTELYYRLNVFPIRIPPLRERQEDIPLLVEYFMEKYASEWVSRSKPFHRRPWRN
jgi:hypothetical protein